MTKICFIEFKEEPEAVSFFCEVNHCAMFADTPSLLPRNTVLVRLSDEHRKQRQFVMRELSKRNGWTIVGPICARLEDHGEDDETSRLLYVSGARVAGSWSCFDRECRKINGIIHVTKTDDILSWRDFSYTQIPTRKMMPDFPPIQGSASDMAKKVFFDTEIAGVIPDLAESLKKEPGRRSSWTSHNFTQQEARIMSEFIKKLPDDMEIVASIQDEVILAPKRKIVKPKGPDDFLKVMDETYRFLCGLNLQDHSIKEQREQRDLVSKLGRELFALGIGKNK